MGQPMYLPKDSRYGVLKTDTADDLPTKVAFLQNTSSDFED